MPITISYPNSTAHAGIDISFTKSRQVFCISGWYDSICGIESTEKTLGEFLKEFGITLKDCRKALGGS